MPEQDTFKSYYDVVIVGGGIQGCGCAQAIAAAGYSVLLLEKNELGSGTSSKSSKLIHGGLRYLESGQFSLVRKSLNERALLSRLAPSLVKLKTFYIPIYKNQRLGRWKLGAGLTLYSLLGNLRRDSRFSLLPKSDWHQLGGLERKNLLCVYQYSDAQTNDQLLTQAVAKSAVELGAVVREHCAFINASRAGDGDIEVSLHSKLASNSDPEAVDSTLRCKLIINAAGPWISEIQKNISFASTGPKVSLVQGSHIELDTPVNDGIFYVESPIDQRPVFIMPWPSGTLVGTTEKAHTGSPESCRPSEEEISYLKQTLLHYFPDYSGQMTHSWAGLRVLPEIKPESKPASSGLRPFSHQARDTIIHQDNPEFPRAISLYGGKLTAYRTTADEVANIGITTLKKLGVSPQRPAQDTANIPLSL